VTEVTPSTFNVVLEVIAVAYTDAHKQRGSHRKLSREDMLLMTLELLHRNILRSKLQVKEAECGQDNQVGRRSTYQVGIVQFARKKKLLQPGCEIEVIVVDMTETPIQWSKKKQKQFYSGKKPTYGKTLSCYRQKERADYLHGT
jgi:hypothetical protein